MNMGQLGVFVKIADVGSFSAAAEGLYTSHSSLVQQAKRMEAELGFALFDRSNRGVTLTAAGAAFYARARVILKLYADSLVEARAISLTQSATVRIAHTPDAPTHLVIEAFLLLREVFPHVELVHVDINRYDVVDCILDGRLDVFETVDSEWINSPELEFCPILDDPLGCLFVPGGPYAGKQFLTLDDVAGKTLYLHDYRMCKDFLDRMSLPNGQIKVEEAPADQGSVLSKCMEGALYLVPKSYAAFYKPLQYAELEGGSPYVVGLVYRKDAPLVVRRLVEAARRLPGALDGVVRP